MYSIFSNYIVAGCSPEVTWTTIQDCGRSFHKIGVVQKFLAVMEINPRKKKDSDIEAEKILEKELMGIPFCLLLLTFHFPNL